MSFYEDAKDKYQVAGSALTGKFHELRILYQTVKSTNTGDDLTQYTEDVKRIYRRANWQGALNQGATEALMA
ncbi:hypothetical protein [Methylophaga pinxianii]|uniref:hypothetical protein n=1 Tax=Methylophaga pinxianii TaxID=2881052 RepID=UPI0032DF3660